jgi:hypothetical protein
MDTHRETVEAFWEALARREFDSAATALHPGVTFEEYDVPGLKTLDDIPSVATATPGS